MASLGRRTAEPTPESIQKARIRCVYHALTIQCHWIIFPLALPQMLDENAQLIQAIVENQNKGRAFEAMQ